MDIHIVDGPPSVGVTRVLQALRGLDLSETSTMGVYTNFIGKDAFRHVGAITKERIKTVLQDFSGAIEGAKGQNHFFIDGSPLSYLALRKLHGLPPDDTMVSLVSNSLKSIAHRVSVTLALPGKNFQPPKNMRVFDPNFIFPYGRTLLDTYKQFGFDPEIADIGEIHQGNFRENAL